MGDFLICEGECTRQSKNLGFVTGRLVGKDGPVITGSGIMKITKLVLHQDGENGKTA